MTNHLVAQGHGVALVSLAAVIPQPASTGVMVTERSYGASGAVFEAGQYIEWRFSNLGTGAKYLALLTQLNLDDFLTAPVTVYTRNQFFAFKRYNATAVRPQLGQDGDWSGYFPRGFVIVLKNLELLA